MPRSTLSQRTYRYVRLSILGAVLALLTAMAAVATTEGPLTSVSAIAYTAGAAVFAGSLYAITVAFVALSGRGAAAALLDLAALMAPLIVIVPTPVVTGDAPGVVVPCDVPCVPDDQLAAVAVGVTAYLVVATAAVLAAAVLGVVQRTLSLGLVATLLVAAGVVVGVALWWGMWPETFVRRGHIVATVAFFALVAAVSALAARSRRRGYRTLYGLVAVLIVLDLIAVVAVLLLRFAGSDLGGPGDVPYVLVGEIVAIALFAAFWVIQTVEHWRDADPGLPAPSR